MVSSSNNSVLQIEVEHQPGHDRLQGLGVFQWLIWTKETSEFPWYYDEQETCYLLEGEVIVTPENGAPVHFGKGDLVKFPAGMACTWMVIKPVKKHYQFG